MPAIRSGKELTPVPALGAMPGINRDISMSAGVRVPDPCGSSVCKRSTAVAASSEFVLIALRGNLLVDDLFPCRQDGCIGAGGE